jgi:protein-disulfide isomerase
MPTMPPKARKAIDEPITDEFVMDPIEADEPLDQQPDIEPETAEETFTFKRSHFYALMTVFAFAAGILLGYVVWGMNSASQPSGPIAGAPVTAEPKFVRYDVPSDGFPFIGPKDAPITIIEFSDYQCPFCRRWHDEVYEPLLAAYPGQIKLVYRNLPLTSIHPDAFSASEAAMCAGEQDAYWPYHEKLFQGESLGSAIYAQYAKELSLDMTSFETCMTKHTYQEEIQADSDFAIQLGVSSTPTFFINGLAIVGAQPLNVFQQIIDKELAGEIPE